SVRYTVDFSLADALPFKPDTDTLCLLDFEEGEGDVAKDASGNGNDGRIHGATWQHMWPCPLPESRLLAVEEAMRKANPGATGLALEVSGVPGGVGVRLVCQEGGSSQIRDISPLASLPLRMLEARGTAISDLAPLRGLPLRFLDLTSSAVEDLSPLERAPITVLKIAETPVRDLAPLRGMPLRFLHLYHCKAVGDLAPLEGLPLEHLSIAGSSVTDVSALAGMPLRSLGLGPNTAVTDFLPLRSCTALELLVVGANPPSTGTLGELRKALPKLSLDTRQWTNVCFHDVLPRIMADLWEEPGPHAPPPASREKLPGKLLVSLLKGDFVAARKEAGGDASPQTLAVCAMQDRILESFRRDVGKTGVVKLRKEQIRCRIRGVTGSDVAVHLLRNRGGATVEAKRVVKYSMLSTEEKFSRLGTGEEPEVLLMRGLLAVEADRLDVAGKLFARSGTPLGVALAGKLQEGRTRRTEEAAGRAARDVLSTVLPSTLSTSREDIIAEIRANCERRSRNLRSPGKASAAPSADTLLSRTRNLRSTRKAFAEYEKKHGETAAGRRWAKLFREAIDFPIPACNWTVPDVGMEFVWINALKMWVGKYEVTNGEYRAFNKANHSGPYLKYSLDGDRQPVVYVSFGEISAYAEWLTKREREAGRLPKQARYRLPAGREYITYAQCGDDRKYPWGNDWPPITGKAGNLGDTTSPMDSKFDTYTDGHPVTCKVEESRENPWGLFGIGGNVQECCANETEGKQTFEAWRGPDWHLHELPYVQCRSSRADAPEGMAFVGFRLVLSLK
ncbi:MAG: SUMF1/EgtB/PvdO family nonheme iron enzyme, partial [Victivallales bacterium]|nr:SUMF1/EgtB/PvdO family nonheme iron enzyme [Victivallales bacterium]